jgi:hypothetical protein
MGLSSIFGFAANQARAVLPGVAQKKKAQPLAPGPSDLAPGSIATGPPSAFATGPQAAVAAAIMAAKLRKQMKTNAGVVKPSSLATAAPPAPKSLVGY